MTYTGRERLMQDLMLKVEWHLGHPADRGS